MRSNANLNVIVASKCRSIKQEKKMKSREQAEEGRNTELLYVTKLLQLVNFQD